MHSSKRTLRPGADLSPRRLAAAVTLLLGLGACSSSTEPGNPGPSNMTARVDGAEWTSSQATAAPVPNAPGWYVISGSVATANQALAISISVYNVDGPGTYPLGVGSTAFGGIAILAEGGGGWVTPLSGAAGSITITALTATRMAGNFSFTAEGSTGGATGTRTVTDGEFGLEFATQNPLTQVPDHVGGRVSATIGGASWSAATIVATAGATSFIMTTSNDQRTLSFVLNNIAGPDTYDIASSQSYVVQVLGPDLNPQGDPCCWTETSGNTGSVTIATMTATRVTGSFSATLAPTPGTNASAPLTITGGTFDVGILQ